MLHFDDRVQAMLFSRTRLAETYPASAITNPFRFNAFLSGMGGPDGRPQEKRALEPRRAAQLAPAEPDHAAYLHRYYPKKRMQSEFAVAKCLRR
jgi:hypothetical protein